MPERMPSTPGNQPSFSEQVIENAEKLANLDEKERTKMVQDWEQVLEVHKNYDNAVDDISKILESAKGNAEAEVKAEKAIKEVWQPAAKEAFNACLDAEFAFEDKWGRGALSSDVVKKYVGKEKFLSPKAKISWDKEVAKKTKARQGIEKRFDTRGLSE
ncbi:MAG: hypothetical protein G01um101419_364 [Parcubacteria group bacterium Gr01-1014_19]|nr:MAG: hypothetical protein G01um101419_364 [Parcubacteria group bacterium Gr01-1014_19]